MIRFKHCPRCRGDLYLAEDMFGKYLNCLQCGYLKDVIEPVEQPNPASVMKDGKARDAA